MNEARSSGPMIDCEAAAALMEPLTDLVVRAGAAILAVNRSAMKIDGKLDGSPVTEADLAADRIIGEGLARLVPDIPALSEERVASGETALSRQLLPDRSARRHQGVCRRPQRIHGQSRAGEQRYAAARHHRRAGARIDLARAWSGAARSGWRSTIRRWAAAEPIRTRQHPAPGAPWIVAVSRSHGDARTEAFIDGAARRGPPDAGLGGEIRPGGGRPAPTSIPASRRPANGTSRPATPSSPRPAARSRMARARRCNSAPGGTDLSCRNSSPGAIRRRRIA